MKDKDEQVLIDLRRVDIHNLLSKGLTQREISNKIGWSLGVVNADIQYLRAKAREDIKDVTNTLTQEMDLSLVRLNNMIRHLHKDLEDTSNTIKDKHNAISLINECTQLRLEILGAGVLANELNHSNNVTDTTKKKENTKDETTTLSN